MPTTESIIKDFVRVNKDSPDLTANEGLILTLLDKAANELTSLRNLWEAAHNRNKKLEALENAGVDNWQGYDFAMESLEDDEDSTP